MPRYEPFDWYDAPLYYDIIFDADTPTEADFLQAAQQRHGLACGHRVLEPACGSGRLVAALAQKGYHVTGFDTSAQMLRFARQRLRGRGLRARLVEDSMESFSIGGSFQLAHCLVSTFKYLLDEQAARSHLQRVARALEPGGVYVLGLHLTDYEDRRTTRERWTGRRDGLEVVCNIQGWPAHRRRRTEQVRSRLIVRRGREERRYETSWTFRTYGPRQLRGLLKSVAALEHVATYDFCHDIHKPIRFDGQHLDTVLVLRRR